MRWWRSSGRDRNRNKVSSKKKGVRLKVRVCTVIVTVKTIRILAVAGKEVDAIGRLLDSEYGFQHNEKIDPFKGPIIYNTL